MPFPNLFDNTNIYRFPEPWTLATQESRRQRPTVEDQNLSLQTDQLTATGCEKIYRKKNSDAKSDRPELARLLDSARPGDTVTVWKLDRLGRSLKHCVILK